MKRLFPKPKRWGAAGYRVWNPKMGFLASHPMKELRGEWTQGSGLGLNGATEALADRSGVSTLAQPSERVSPRRSLDALCPLCMAPRPHWG